VHAKITGQLSDPVYDELILAQSNPQSAAQSQLCCISQTSSTKLFTFLINANTVKIS